MPTPNQKKQKQAKDTAVQGTNDSSVVSKVSAAAQGYFQDAFLQHFVCKVARRAPLINRGYYVRWRAVDHCVRRFLQATLACPRRQIVSLGAGFDSLYFRLLAEDALEGTAVFEVDFPDVARRKVALISANVTLRETLGPTSPPETGAVHVSGGQYKLLGVDVREETQVEEALGAAGLDWAAPTLILSEVVLTYMETKWSDSVIEWAAKRFPCSLFVMYEQIRPYDPFGRIMQDHFLKLNSTLHALHQYSDTTAQRSRFLEKGWEQCVCLDLNEFYLGLIDEDERHRIDGLEPFDEYEDWHQKCSHYFILTASRGSLTGDALLTHPRVPAGGSPVRSLSLSVQTAPGEVRLEGLGMASTSLAPGRILVTGGSNRRGRGAPLRVLVRGQVGWRSACVESSTDWGVRLYHTVTPLDIGGAVVYGGRSSPLNPIGSLLKVAVDQCDPIHCDERDTVKLCVKEMACTGAPPQPRWRHTSTIVSHEGKDFLFVFGGKSESRPFLGDGHFLCVDQQHWTEILVEGTAPEARLSHSACPYRGGLVMFGGLGSGDVPLGDTMLLKPTERGFCWDKLVTHPPPAPRYSHSAHVIGERLVLVGGVWLCSEGVPGCAVIDLTTGRTAEFTLNTTSVPWPVMLHSFCSELMDPEDLDVILIGGGGNCFSFGTHLNPQPVTVNLRALLG